MVELEKAYDDFCEINDEHEALVSEEENEEYRVVNGEDLPTYRNNVNKTYMEARNTFSQAKLAATLAVSLAKGNNTSAQAMDAHGMSSAQVTFQAQADPVYSQAADVEPAMVSAQFASVLVSAGGGLTSSIVTGAMSVSNLSSPLVIVSTYLSLQLCLGLIGLPLRFHIVTC